MIVHQCWLVGFVFVVVVSLSRALPAGPQTLTLAIQDQECFTASLSNNTVSFQLIKVQISQMAYSYMNISVNIDSWHTPNQNSNVRMSNKHPIQNIHCSFTSVHVQTNVIMNCVKHGKLWKPKLWKKHIFAERRPNVKRIKFAIHNDDYFEVSVCIHHGSTMNHCWMLFWYWKLNYCWYCNVVSTSFWYEWINFNVDLLVF